MAIITAVLVLPLTGCAAEPDTAADQGNAGGQADYRPWIPEFVRGLPLEVRVGQLFVTAFGSWTGALDMIKRYHVGGFVYSRGDAKDPAQTARLSNALQRAANIPLLLRLDSGALPPYLTLFPGHLTMSAAPPADAQAAAKITEEELRAIGVAQSLPLVRDQIAAVRALKTGTDQVLTPPDLPTAYQSVLDAVRHGTISQQRLNTAVGRILMLKEKRGLFAQRPADPNTAAQTVGSAGHRAVARIVAAHAITLVRNDGVLPLHGQKVYVTGASGPQLAKALGQLGVRVVPAQGGADVTVLTTSDAGASTAARVSALTGHQPVVVVALGQPGDLRYTGKAAAALAAYTSGDGVLQALARVLTGAEAPTGRLPVAIPHSYASGSGLTY
jgi:beta-glucosidase-like glycosyl hydrolase